MTLTIFGVTPSDPRHATHILSKPYTRRTQVNDDVTLTEDRVQRVPLLKQLNIFNLTLDEANLIEEAIREEPFGVVTDAFGVIDAYVTDFEANINSAGNAGPAVLKYQAFSETAFIEFNVTVSTPDSDFVAPGEFLFSVPSYLDFVSVSGASVIDSWVVTASGDGGLTSTYTIYSLSGVDGSYRVVTSPNGLPLEGS